MSGPCLCGDVYCPKAISCDWIYEVLLADMHESINIDWWSEELANRLGKHQEIADAILLSAKKHEWSRNE